jgi:hypothetical protein
MGTIKINIIRQDAFSILKVMEEAGLISMPKKDVKIKNLAQQLRGTISGFRAKEMSEFVDKERGEWEKRY